MVPKQPIPSVGVNDTCIIMADNHPAATMESMYSLIFPCVIKLSQLRQNYRTLIMDKLLLRPLRQNSIALNKRYTSLSVMNAIRRDLYQKLGIPKTRKVDCSFLRVLIVWRRDYQNHPGNLAKLIDRKISNEDEVLQTIVNKLSFVNISDVQLEQLPLREQIILMSQVDVFWGMHGAGHAMSVFMRPKSAVVELLPLQKGSNWHMGQLSVLADHHHISTKIAQPGRYRKPARNSPDSTYYYVDSETVIESLNKAHDKLC
ncbi:uncharacterized protein LOC142348833 isoform X2 [Convolutriloba macropyga]|uniref:uncharacterized protein LOC142348833 isoform X2 n=1 Tax=Convolutriloba macropyga TaxID=536237 RepID=UPI003F5239D1